MFNMNDVVQVLAQQERVIQSIDWAGLKRLQGAVLDYQHRYAEPVRVAVEQMERAAELVNKAVEASMPVWLQEQERQAAVRNTEPTIPWLVGNPEWLRVSPAQRAAPFEPEAPPRRSIVRREVTRRIGF